MIIDTVSTTLNPLRIIICFFFFAIIVTCYSNFIKLNKKEAADTVPCFKHVKYTYQYNLICTVHTEGSMTSQKGTERCAC